MRELRHDFRAYYSCRYDDVEAGEAVDLIMTLPAGSAYMATVDPALEWSREQDDIADVKDAILYTAYLLSGNDASQAPRVVRPLDIVRREQARARAASARRTIEETEWVEA